VPVSERWYWREERPGVWVPEPDDEPEVPHESEAESSVPLGDRPLTPEEAEAWDALHAAAAELRGALRAAPEPRDAPAGRGMAAVLLAVCGPLAAYYAGVWGMFGVAAAVWMLVARSRIDLDR
jgi:hypothetical protein